MKLKVLRNHIFVIFVMDIVLLGIAWYCSFLIRFDFSIPSQFVIVFKRALPLVVITKVISFYLFDLYSGMWRYTSTNDLLNIIRSTSIAFLCIIFAILLVTRFYNVPRSVFVIDWTTTGASPPMATSPILICRVFRRLIDDFGY